MKPLECTFYNNAGLLKFLKWICFFMLIGRAYQCLVWDIPIRGLIWDEGLLSGIVPPLTGMTWQEYVTSPKVDCFMTYLVKFFGLFLAVSAVASLFAQENRKWIKRLFDCQIFFSHKVSKTKSLPSKYRFQHAEDDKRHTKMLHPVNHFV